MAMRQPRNNQVNLRDFSKFVTHMLKSEKHKGTLENVKGINFTDYSPDKVDDGGLKKRNFLAESQKFLHIY